MALMDFIKKQFIDIIQWTEDDGDTMAWRFPMAEFEIQHGASLTVRESQMAVFVNEGKVADVFGPGMYKLTTQTLPVLTYLKNWDKLFESPFKSDVYFFSTRQKIDRKWGTPNPVTIRDKDFGMVRLRAFGIYAFHLTDPKAFHTTLSGTMERYGSEDLEGQLRNTIVGHISDIFGESGVPFIDMAGNQEEFGKALKAKLDPMFGQYGLSLDSLNVQNISLPEELQAMLDKRIGVNMMGGMQAYTQFQTAEAIPLAAQNEGGLAGLGAGMGVGFGMGQQIAGAMSGALNPAAAPAASPAAAAPAPTPAAAPVSADEIVASIEKLHGLVGKGILSQAEFDAKKAELLKKLG
ncbi:SPFH domain-containing protein [Sulfuritalea hydrogenivorans]|uniref:Transmembrane protein n=1 Tax=Sulfuritalea hydrogenivorans sk43H TaxID=1223802 RepID=W0S9K9_9PROT|nr:SPFH domain-containing protein [Sulfuritalea hydrogenivorans]BAO27864.1 transmembrane protein [Sulfuritalea hydrogenivorans sk43H]